MRADANARWRFSCAQCSRPSTASLTLFEKGAQPCHPGIDARNIAEVAAQGVASAAVITAITRAADPETRPW